MRQIPTFKQLKIDELKRKQFFELEDLHKHFPKAWLFLIKGKKGIGKSYQINKLLRQISKTSDKFIYVRTRYSDLQISKNTFDTNAKIPFTIEGHKIINKDTGEQQGMAIYANSLGKFRSQNYEGYKYIIYDEYIGLSKKDYTEYNFFASTFIKFIMDVNRDYDVEKGGVSPLKCYMFGNNNLVFDPFNEYFKIDVKDTWFNYCEELGIVIADLKEYYLGMLEETKAYGLAYFDNQLHEFLTSNKSTENISQMINYSATENGIIEKYIISEGYYIEVIRSIKEPDKFIFKSTTEKVSDTIPCLCFNKQDYLLDNKAIFLELIQALPLIESWRLGIKKGVYFFVNNTSKELIYNIMKRYENKNMIDL